MEIICFIAFLKQDLLVSFEMDNFWKYLSE